MKKLRRWLADGRLSAGRSLHAADESLDLGILQDASALDDHDLVAGRSVLLSTGSQLAAALALIELDGLARRIVICPPDLKADHLAAVIAGAEVDAVVTDGSPEAFAPLGIPRACEISLPLQPRREDTHPGPETEWILLTSGTTGVPKMARHTLSGLTGAIASPPEGTERPVWGTFYDIRRYGGLQIFLRAIVGGGSIILSTDGEMPADHLRRLAQHRVTHQTGTPSHWRRALMCPEATLIDPAYVRLSGEIADQPILDALRRAYPRARIGHAYASTEAGVGFEVDDEREGFPAAFLERDGAVEMRMEDGSLRIRSQRTASTYLGSGSTLRDREGWVDTDDMVEQRGDRCYFVGRRSGIINVGGLKVHPEEVEAVINRHDRVRMSLVKPRQNPITGAIVVADVVLNSAVPPASDASGLKSEILDICRAELPQYKVPVLLRFIEGLEMTAGGKLRRSHA